MIGRKLILQSRDDDMMMMILYRFGDILYYLYFHIENDVGILLIVEHQVEVDSMSTIQLIENLKMID